MKNLFMKLFRTPRTLPTVVAFYPGYKLLRHTVGSEVIYVSEVAPLLPQKLVSQSWQIYFWLHDKRTA